MDTQFAHELRLKAMEVGFSRVGFAELDPPAGVAAYDAFIAEGRHADMTWMAESREARANPKQLLPGAQSMVSLGIDYYHPRPKDPGGLTGKVSRYAWGRDYHNLIGKRLDRVVRWIRAQGVVAWGGVDHRPFIERAWAERAGLGFSARNACMIRPGEGSYFFLAVILVGRTLPPDPPIRAGLERFCGACRRCHDLCPTQAFTGDGQLDARRCISWATIECRGAIPLWIRPHIGRWLYGCDECQEVCPHNHRPPNSQEPDLAPRDAWVQLDWLLGAPESEIQQHFVATAFKRAGVWGLRRNAMIVLGNIADSSARPHLLPWADGTDEVLADHARWAIDRLNA
jgi:epoxyqueuosine reductase